MKDLVFFIAAQETNKYHELGDLAPFGDTTLLQWKISQCKKIVEDDCIYISSASDKVEDICIVENINYIRRTGLNIENELKLFSNKNRESTIIWANTTAPFLGNIEFLKMYYKFIDSKCDLLVSVLEKKDYVFYNKEKVNFKGFFTDRASIDPVFIATNGAYIFNNNAVNQSNNILDTEKIYFYKLDKLSAIEIKDIIDYSISKDLISIHFNKLVR